MAKYWRTIMIVGMLIFLLMGCSGATETAAPAPTAQPTTLILPTAALSPTPAVEQTALPADPGSESAAVAQARTSLAGLPLDEFFEAAFRTLMLRSPEAVLEAGLQDIYDVQTVELTNISDAYLRETYQIQAVILELLYAYDRATLPAADQRSYDVFAWYLEDQLAGQEFMYYDYPATYFPITSVPLVLVSFFTDIHPLQDRQDAQDYLTRLGLVDEKLAQLMEGLQIREQAGIIPPRFALQWALPGLNEIAQAPAQYTPFYTSFAGRLDQVAGLSAEEKLALLAEAKTVIEETVLPAYQEVADYVATLQAKAPQAVGVGTLPEGEAYYAYALRHHTTTDLTPSEIHALGLQEVARLQGELREAFDALGYPQDASMNELFRQAAADGGSVAGPQVLATYTELIEAAQANLAPAFDLQPRAEVIVVGDEYGGFYVPGAVDGSRPGMFYANVSGASEPYFGMPSLAYHEAVPGHHFQISLALESELPDFRNGLIFTAYAEGWALYAERLVWEMGWYADDPYGDLGRLQFEMFRAVRLVVDTGIHSQGWTFNQAVAYMEENIGYGPSIGSFENQVARYCVWPGQATSYMIGFLDFLELRQQAMTALGDQFDLVEFHHVILSQGSMPLPVLEGVVQEYIAERANP